MKPIKIVTDSTVQLSKEEQDKYNITIVPLTAMVENVVYYDNLTVTKPEFLQKMLNSPELPKTSQPAVGKFTELFNELGADGSEVLSIHVAGYLSGTYMSAVQGASLSTAKVTVIESGFLDRAMAFQVLAAAEMAKTGAAINVRNSIYFRRGKIKNYFICRNRSFRKLDQRWPNESNTGTYF